MENYLKLFRNHEEYEEYKREHPTPEPKPIHIPPIPIPNHVIKYSATSEISINENKFDANLMVHDFTDGVGIVLFDGEITTIYDSAFYSYDILTSIDLPSNIISIGSSALEGCVSLTSITVNSDIPPRLSFNVFYDTNNCPIYVPNESIDDYKASSYWTEYIDRIQPIDPSYEARWVEDGTMCDNYNLYVKEKLQVSHDSGTTWEDGGETRKGSLIEAKSAECGYEPISNKTITYNSASKLVETTSNKDTGLHTNAFNTSITSHTFSNGGGEIGFENDVTSVGSYAFYNCGITNIEIPNSVTNIGESAFYQCSRLTSIDIPSGVTNIGYNAFYGCSSLESIDIPNSVTSINYNAFTYCSGLTSCTIGSGVTSIGTNAFYGCTSLTRVTVNAVTPPTMGNNYVFNDTNDCPIYVPSDSVNAYKSASYWRDYANRIQAIQ